MTFAQSWTATKPTYYTQSTTVPQPKFPIATATFPFNESFSKDYHVDNDRHDVEKSLPFQ